MPNITINKDIEFQEQLERVVRKVGNAGHILIPKRHINKKALVFILNRLILDKDNKKELIKQLQNDIKNIKKKGLNHISAMYVKKLEGLVSEIKENREINPEEIEGILNKI